MVNFLRTRLKLLSSPRVRVLNSASSARLRSSATELGLVVAAYALLDVVTTLFAG